MGNPLEVVLLTVAVTGLWLVPAVLTGRLARREGRSPVVYTIASLIVGWPIAVIAALRKARAGRRTTA